MYSILLDVVDKEFDESKVIDLGKYLFDQNLDASIIIYHSNIESSIISKLKRKKLINLEFVKVKSETTCDQVVKDFVLQNQNQNIILIRREVENWSISQIDEMIVSHLHDNKVVNVRKKSRFEFLHSLWHKFKNIIFETIFGIRTYDGGNSLLLLDKTIVTSICQNPSSIIKLSKLDNFKLVNKQTIIDNDYKVDKGYPKSKNKAIKFYVCNAILFLFIVAFVLISILIQPSNKLIYYLTMTSVLLTLIIISFCYTSSFLLFKNAGNLEDQNIKFIKELK